MPASKEGEEVMVPTSLDCLLDTRPERVLDAADAHQYQIVRFDLSDSLLVFLLNIFSRIQLPVSKANGSQGIICHHLDRLADIIFDLLVQLYDLVV